MLSFRQVHDLEADGYGLVREQADRIIRAASPYDPGIFERFARIMARRTDHNMIAPPFIVTEADTDRIVERFGDAVDAALAAQSGPI